MKIIFHHAPHDIPIIAEMFGMSVEALLRAIAAAGGFEDTMMKSFCLRLTPQGLKALMKRYCAMDQPSYPTIVRPADRKIATEYLYRVLDPAFECAECSGTGMVIVQPMHKSSGKQLDPRPEKCPQCEGDGLTWPPPRERLEWDTKKGRAYLSRGHRIGSRVRGILKSIREDPETDARARWNDIDYEFRLGIEDKLGPVPEVSLNDVEPQSVAVNYSAADADGTTRSDRVLDTMLAEEGPELQNVYRINQAATPLLILMMDIGTHVDVPRLQTLDEKLENEYDILLYKLERAVGHYVNPNSFKQVGELLFDELRLPPVKETKSGDNSTDDKVLEDLKLYVGGLENSPHNEKCFRILNHITDGRERRTLRSRYTLALPRAVDAHGRIHTTFKETRTDTNRLSSAYPNLQNIPDPEKKPVGAEIKAAFDVEPGWVMVAADYAQIEVRVLAHECKDPVLIDAIHRGLDIHMVTATRIFKKKLHKKGCECGQCPTSRERKIAKRITFLILYGGGAPRLKAELKLEGIEVTIEESQGFIDAYLDGYPGISDFMDDKIAEARRHGYVTDMWGWRRYLPGVHSEIMGVRSEAERQAVNTTIQSGAAGIMKIACPIIFDELMPWMRKKGYEALPLLTVHDELIMQVKAGGERLLMERLTDAMCREIKLDVPVTADAKFGRRWTECH